MQSLYPPSIHELQRQAPAVYPFAVNNACAQIKSSCKGLGADEDALTEVLCSVTPNDRSLIAHRYKELYLEELKFLLQSETSSDLGFLLQLLAVPLNEAEAYVLHAAVTGPINAAQLIYPVCLYPLPCSILVRTKSFLASELTSVGAIHRWYMQVVLGRTSAELVILKKTYFDIFNQELSVMANSELGGDFRKIVLTALQVPQRQLPLCIVVCHADEPLVFLLCFICDSCL